MNKKIGQKKKLKNLLFISVLVTLIGVASFYANSPMQLAPNDINQSVVIQGEII